MAFGDDVVQSNEAQAHAIFGQLKDRGFGAVQDRIGIVLGFEGLLLNRAVAWIRPRSSAFSFTMRA